MANTIYEPITAGWCEFMHQLRGSVQCQNCAFNHCLNECSVAYVAKTNPEQVSRQLKMHRLYKQIEFTLTTIN